MAESTSNNRRREERLPAKKAAFTLESNGQKFTTHVVNMSRLGLGIELPETAPQELKERMIVGATVEGELSLPHGATAINATVRVRRDAFLGLEYNISSADFLNRLRALLSPHYIASTIQEIAQDLISGDTERAYRGDEFECLIFKTSKLNPTASFQFFAAGRFVEVIGEEARFVPLPLVRQAGGNNDFEYVLEFFEVEESHTQKELAAFFNFLSVVADCWDACPPQIKNIIGQHTKK